MKKLTKKDYLYMIINIIIFLLFIFILCENTYLYGSISNWLSQYITIPDYFRSLFYETKDIFPDLALNIGNGQNIYNLAYYGLLSPFILVSYLLPFIPMSTYLIITTIISCLLSSILIYIFLYKKNFHSEICFISSFIFLMTTSITFNSHHHIMFINYLPFLILGLFGIDKKIDKGRSWLLIISTFLMIMTSYYFSIGGIICLLIYTLYRYLNKMNIITFKTLFQTFFSIFIPIIVAVLMSCILTLPTLATIINNYSPSNIVITIKDLLLPDLSFQNILYDYYGIGLSAIIIPSLINLFFKNKANIILGIILIIFATLNIINYLINGTLEINSKSLIPMLPLYIYIIAFFLEDLFTKKLNYKILIFITLILSIIITLNNSYFLPYLIEITIILITSIIYYKTNKKAIFIIPLILCLFTNNLFINKTDKLILKEDYNYQENTIKDRIDLITGLDEDFYRINNNLSINETTNNIYNNLNYYSSTIYSSISNPLYNNFYYNNILNNNSSNNRESIVSNSNILFLMLSGNKYLISNNRVPLGYETVSSHNGIYIYRNNNVFPLGFATSNIMNYDDFNKLSDQVKQEALLNVIVADKESSNNFISNTRKITIDYKDIFTSSSSLFKEEKDGSISLNTQENLKITYKLPKKYQNKIIFIRLKVQTNQGEVIKINNVLKESSNNQEVFDYILANQDQTELIFNFTKGSYNISDFETYLLDYASIETLSSKVDRLIIDKNQTKGDKINGTINVIQDGYFMFTIPYDYYFIIKVDNQEIKYEKVDDAFIGFPITSGTHNISLEYVAPLKKLSAYCSIFGFVVFVIITVLESHKKIS